MQAENAQPELKLTIEACFKAQEASTNQWAARLENNPAFNLEYRLMQLMKQRLLEKSGNDLKVLKEMIHTGKSMIGPKTIPSQPQELTFTAIKTKKIEKLDEIINGNKDQKMPKLKQKSMSSEEFSFASPTHMRDERQKFEVSSF